MTSCITQDPFSVETPRANISVWTMSFSHFRIRGIQFIDIISGQRVKEYFINQFNGLTYETQWETIGGWEKDRKKEATRVFLRYIALDE